MNILLVMRPDILNTVILIFLFFYYRYCSSYHATRTLYGPMVLSALGQEPMSYSQAAQVMLDGMGTQFDPILRDAFLLSQKMLEDYYQNLTA